MRRELSQSTWRPLRLQRPGELRWLIRHVGLGVPVDVNGSAELGATVSMSGEWSVKPIQAGKLSADEPA